MKYKVSVFILIFAFLNFSQVDAQDLKTVSNVDLNKYIGKWYEIAAFPQRFERNCHCSSADYTFSKKKYLFVINHCRKDSTDGKENAVKGKAFVQKNTGNARLKVQFFWPFRAKYWIIDLAKDYSYAVVSHPNKKYLWILSRTKKMDSKVYEEIISRLKEKGFDTGKLKIMDQVCYNQQRFAQEINFSI